jgi:hypothetical protein
MQQLRTAILLVAALAGRAAADAKSDALAQAGTAIAELVHHHGYEFSAGHAAMEAILTSADQCTKGVDAAKAAGAKTGDIVTVTIEQYGGHDDALATWGTVDTNGGTYKPPIDDARVYCAAWAKRVSLDLARDTTYYMDGWVDKLTGDNAMTYAEEALISATKCTAAVDTAVAYGNGADATVEISAGKRSTKTIKLGDIKATLCEPIRAAAQKLLDAAEAAEEAEMEPYKKVLKGDKWTVWEESFGLEVRGTGVGGVDLETPQEFAKAKVWFTSYHGEDSGCAVGESWHLYKWKFKGNKLVGGKPTEKAGCGSSPPTKAYR